MSINEERKIILDELYYYFDKHRISHDRLYDRIKALKKMDESGIASALDGLCNDGHIKPYPAINSMEYQITASGEALLFEDQKQPMSGISISGIFNNSPVITQSRDLLLDLDGKNATVDATTNIKKNVNPIDKPDGWLNKLSIFWNSAIGKIIIGIIIGTIIWFVKYYLEISHGLINQPANKQLKVDTATVKKH